MGSSPSQELLPEPWRTIDSDTKNLLDFVQSYKPKNEDVENIRILIHGPVGAGKSSFINSVESVLQDRVTDRAPVDAISGKSYTKAYKTYKFPKENGGFYHFIFNDTTGYEKNINSGVKVTDMKLVLGGHVHKNYEFQPNKSLKEGDYKTNPTLQDKVHVLVSVVPASSVDLLSPDIWKKMRDVRGVASEMGIPQVVILTKVDESPEVGSNFENVYKSKNLKKQVDKLQTLLGIPTNRIFLVKNVWNEEKINDTAKQLILSALKQILQSGEDFLNNLDS